MEQLTPREKQIVDLVCTGLTNGEIAEILGLKRKTIQNHLYNIYSKTDITRRSQLIPLFVAEPLYKIQPEQPAITIIKKRKEERNLKKKSFALTKNDLQDEVNRLKTQRLKAALIAASLIDYIDNNYIRNELKTLMAALRP